MTEQQQSNRELKIRSKQLENRLFNFFSSEAILKLKDLARESAQYAYHNSSPNSSGKPSTHFNLIYRQKVLENVYQFCMGWIALQKDNNFEINGEETNPDQYLLQLDYAILPELPKSDSNLKEPENAEKIGPEEINREIGRLELVLSEFISQEDLKKIAQYARDYAITEWGIKELPRDKLDPLILCRRYDLLIATFATLGASPLIASKEASSLEKLSNEVWTFNLPPLDSFEKEITHIYPGFDENPFY